MVDASQPSLRADAPTQIEAEILRQLQIERREKIRFDDQRQRR